MKKSPHTTEYKLFLELLYELRTQKGLRQVDLANLLNVPQSFVSKYENGERRLDIIEVKNICDGLGVSLKDFSEKLESLLNDC